MQPETILIRRLWYVKRLIYALMVSALRFRLNHNVTEKVKTISMETESTRVLCKKTLFVISKYNQISRQSVGLAFGSALFLSLLNNLSQWYFCKCNSCLYLFLQLLTSERSFICGLTVCRVCQSNVLETCLEMTVGLYAWHSRVEYLHLNNLCSYIEFWF